jgi:hypothetical protein
MGWGRMLLLGNIGQQLDIQDTERALAQMAHQLRETGQFDREVARRLDHLAAENAEMKLYLAAIVRLLASKNVVSSAELREIVDAIDRSDGSADGRLTGRIPPPEV